MQEASDNAVWVGTANWTDHQDFYPPGLPAGERLSYYARFFPFVEVNASFYRPFGHAQYARWAERTPPDFRMAVKAYRGLSLHLKDEPPSEAMVNAHLEATTPLVEAGKFAAFVVQFPPWIRKTEKMSAYLRELRGWFGDATVAMEFRHASWFSDGAESDTLAFLRELRVANVILDEPDPARTGLIPTVREITAPDLVYYRFQGRDELTGTVTNKERHEAREQHVYSPPEITELAELITRLHASGHASSFVVIHNNYSNHAVKAGMEMMLVLREKGVRVRLGQERLAGT